MTERGISDEQAQRIWRRAAELQAAAAERAEHRRRSIAAGTGATDDGLSIRDIKEAAVEAGIGDDFVEAAFAELQSEKDLGRRPGSWLARSADKLLDRPPHVLTVTCEIPSRPADVFESMQRVFPNPPFGLLFRDTHGSDLFVDGVLLFEAAGPKAGFQRKLADLGVTHLLVTVRAVREYPDRCDVTIRAPTGRLGLKVLTSGGLTAIGGGSGAVAGAAVGPGLAAVLGVGGIFFTVVTGAAAIVTGVAAGGLALSGCRALFERAIHSVVDSLESMLQAVAVDVRTRGVFAARPRETASGPVGPA